MSASTASSRWLKVILRSVLALALFAGLGWSGRWVWKQISPGLFGNKRVDKIPTARVKTATIAEEIVTVGRVRAVFSTELRAEVNGRIVKISAADGQKVVRDQEILRLDQQDTLTQLQEAERSIEAARLRAERARSEFARQQDLQARGLITAKDFDESRITLSLAENDAAIFEARAANLRDKLTKTVIRAPYDGTLLLRDLTEGQVVTSAAAQNGGTLLGEVADLSAQMVRTNINAIDVARLKLGEDASVRIDPLRNVTMTGIVRRIATSATESQTDRTRVFPIDVVLDTADPRLRPGMSATITFTLSRVENTTAVPLSAVFTTAESVRYVFVKKDDLYEVRGVEIGIADTRRVQILSGLESGAEVALSRPLEFQGEIPSPPPGSVPASRPARKNGR